MLNMETYRIQQALCWVQEELFDKVQDKWILVSSNLRWIHRILVVEDSTCHSSTECRGRMMLCFRGSDYIIFLISTWYDRMEDFLMD